jgi:hypothetical protein
VDNGTLDAYTLQITDLIMDAAKIEGLDDVLRDQAILAFKVKTLLFFFPPLFREVQKTNEFLEFLCLVCRRM